jgi:DNA-binding protein
MCASTLERAEAINPHATREQIFQFRDRLIEQVRIKDLRIGTESTIKKSPFNEGQ